MFDDKITESVLKSITPEQSNQNKKPIPCSDAYITLHVNNSQLLGINDVQKVEKRIASQLHACQCSRD